MLTGTFLFPLSVFTESLLNEVDHNSGDKQPRRTVKEFLKKSGI